MSMRKEKECMRVLNEKCPCLALLVLFFSLFLAGPLSAQTDFSMQSADGIVAVEVSRGAKGVEITMHFTNATQIDNVMIEKSGDPQNGFSQCRYVKFNETGSDSVTMVKRDSYPYTASQDVYYRVKIITKDGASRVYSSVRLPGVKELK
jgi:hypothetical protein